MAGLLVGTVALVTGASSGIGEATAVALAREGAAVAIAARRRARLDKLADLITAEGTVLVHETDITDEHQVRTMVTHTVAELGRLDIVINNAGVMLQGAIVGAPTEEWRRMVHLNLLGLLYCTHAALPHLLQAAMEEPRQVADVVNVSSLAGRVARQNNGVYSATKFGVAAFSESLRQEVTARHVRVTIVEPGPVATELIDRNRPEIQQMIRQNIGDIERLQAEDIASAVLYAVTRPRHVAVSDILLRPTELQR